MLKRIKPRLTYANVMSSLAVFMVLGGGFAYAQTIGTNDIQNRAVTKPKLAGGAVGTAKIERRAVGTGKIKPNAVGIGKMKNNSVGTDQLRDGSVEMDKIANEAVGTEKIAPEAVETGKIAQFAVDHEKIAPGAVNHEKLANGAVIASKFGAVLTRTNTTNVGANSAGTVSVSCQPGEQLLSGGGGFIIGTAAPHPQVVHSSRGIGNTWRVRGFNPAGFARTLTVQAVCLQS